MSIVHASDDTFDALVLHAGHPVLVDFWATWCGPCRMLAPEIDRLAAKYEGRLDVVKLDIDANPAVTARYNVMSVPTIALFAPDQTPTGVAGFMTAEQLEARLGLGSL